MKTEMDEREHYDHLIRVSERYQLLVDALLEASMLGYREEELRFDSEKIEPIFKVLEYESYDYRLKTLQEAKKKAETSKEKIEPMD